MRAWQYIIISILSTMLFGCGNEPDKIVMNYCTSLDAGKLDDALSYLSTSAKQELEKAGKLSASQAEMKRFATSVKAHLQKLQEPKTKAVQKEQDKKWKR